MTLIATRPTEYPCKRFMCSNFQQTMGHLAKLELLLLKHEDIGRRGKVFRNVNSDLPYLSSVQPKTQFEHPAPDLGAGAMSGQQVLAACKPPAMRYDAIRCDAMACPTMRCDAIRCDM